jgi:calcineurin-like phosphoesterase family protein
VWVLGDAAFTVDGLESFRALPGRKILVRGNHDELPVQMYLSVFEEVYGITRYKKSWLTHAPIHPDELRGKSNIHGHVHLNTIPDARYVNVSAEVIAYTPVNYRDVIA